MLGLMQSWGGLALTNSSRASRFNFFRERRGRSLRRARRLGSSFFHSHASALYWSTSRCMNVCSGGEIVVRIHSRIIYPNNLPSRYPFGHTTVFDHSTVPSFHYLQVRFSPHPCPSGLIRWLKYSGHSCNSCRPSVVSLLGFFRLGFEIWDFLPFPVTLFPRVRES